MIFTDHPTVSFPLLSLHHLFPGAGSHTKSLGGKGVRVEAESQGKEEPPEGPSRTHVGHADASAEGDLALGLDSVKLRQDAASVWGECGQHFTVTGMGEEALL